MSNTYQSQEHQQSQPPSFLARIWYWLRFPSNLLHPSCIFIIFTTGIVSAVIQKLLFDLLGNYIVDMQRENLLQAAAIPYIKILISIVSWTVVSPFILFVAPLLTRMLVLNNKHDLISILQAAPKALRMSIQGVLYSGRVLPFYATPIIALIFCHGFIVPYLISQTLWIAYICLIILIGLGGLVGLMPWLILPIVSVGSLSEANQGYFISKDCFVLSGSMITTLFLIGAACTYGTIHIISSITGDDIYIKAGALFSICYFLSVLSGVIIATISDIQVRQAQLQQNQGR